ncbi:MAG: hypothetical protein ACRDIB_19260 [Ardenticatenaceae bacterium]
MRTMQEFYLRLFQSTEAVDSYLRYLAELTKASRDRVAALRSEEGWTAWS